MNRLCNLAKVINTATKTLKPEEQFLKDFIYTIENSGSNYKPSQCYKPSSLGGCKRGLYFQRCAAPIDDKPKVYTLTGMGESGTNRHVNLQTYISKMKDMGLDCEWLDVAEFLKDNPVHGTEVVKHKGMETKCYNEVLDMRFLCDGLIRYKGELYIVEIKTESMYKWEGQVKPFDDHITQATAYSLCLGVPNILFIYENRDNCDLKAFIVHVTKRMQDERVTNVIEEVEDYLHNKEVPPKTTIKKQCNYCQYKNECKKW